MNLGSVLLSSAQLYVSDYVQNKLEQISSSLIRGFFFKTKMNNNSGIITLRKLATLSLNSSFIK